MQAVLLGAGASYDCGMPLVWELTAEIRRWLTKQKLVAFNNNWKQQGGGWCDEVISNLIDLLENNDLHYENIIGAIEVEFARERNELKRQDYHAAHGFLLQAVYGLLLERQIKNSSYAISALKDFKGLESLVEKNKPLWVFSLNHDSILEMLAANLSIPIKSGFNEKVKISMTSDGKDISIVEFERLSRETIKSNGYDFFKAGEKGINLIKLHGSLDIFGQADELNYLKVKSINGEASSYPKHLELIDSINRKLSINHRVVCTNESVYLDELGEIQFLRKSLLSGAHKFSKKISQIAPPEFLSLFKGNINYASELICIGYSFGDKHYSGPRNPDNSLSYSLS